VREGCEVEEKMWDDTQMNERVEAGKVDEKELWRCTKTCRRARRKGHGIARRSGV
jgi:hypothetical protein